MKKVISILLVIGMAICFGGCSEDSSDSMADIYYDDEKLGGYYSSYEMSDYTQEIDGSCILGSYEKLNGMVLLWNYDAEEATALDINYKLKVSHGKGKLIMVDPDGVNTVIEELENNITADTRKTQSFSLQEGLYRVFLVGTEDAAAEVEVEVAVGDFYGAK